MNTRKLFGFFCNDRLPFVNETMYSKETENCLYSHLLGKQRWVWWVKRDLWRKAVPISRGRSLKIQTKTIFYCSHIQCNSLLYLPTFSFLARPYNKLTYKRIGKLSPICTCARLTCKQPVPAFHSHLDEFVSNNQEAIFINWVYQSPCSCSLQTLSSWIPPTATRNVLCISSNVQCCSFNFYATIYEDLCCSCILKKKGMYVPGTAIDVCIVLTLA